MAEIISVKEASEALEGNWYVVFDNREGYIPKNSSSRGTKEVLAWIAEGNTPEPADPPPPEPTTEDLANSWLGQATNRAIIEGIAEATGTPFGLIVAEIQKAARGN